MDLRHLIFLILFCLSAGTFLTFGFVKRKEVGPGYYFYHGLITFSTSFLAYLFLGTEAIGKDAGVWFLVYLIASLVFSLTMGNRKENSPKKAATLSKIAGASYFLTIIAAMGTLLLDITITAPFGIHTQLIWNSILSSSLMGFSMACMLLGHWYLTQPKMSIEELKRLSLIFILLIVVRFLVGTAGFVQLLYGRSEAEIYRYLLGGSVGTFALMRWVWGLLAPLLLSYFIWGTVKIRSTQSATGILYVVVLFVMTGEIISQYLAYYYGVVF